MYLGVPEKQPPASIKNAAARLLTNASSHSPRALQRPIKRRILFKTGFPSSKTLNNVGILVSTGNIHPNLSALLTK